MQGSDDIEAQAATVYHDITQHRDNMSRSALYFHCEWFQWVALSRKAISGLLSLLCYSCSRHSCVDLNGSLVSSTGLSSVVLSQHLPSLFPLGLPAPNNRYGNVPGCRLKASHERGGGGGWAFPSANVRGWEQCCSFTYKLAWNFTGRSIWCHFCEQAATWDARMQLSG